jgi:hypothetical protein
MFRIHTANEASEVTPASAGSRKRGRSFRLVISLAAALSVAGLLGTLGSGPAGATVANNGINRAYANVDGTGCQVVVGDRADPTYGSAIGEVDVTRCPYYYNIVVRVYLDHANYYNGPLTTVKETQAGAYTYQYDVWTGSACGYHSGTDYWYTYANVSFNGGQTWSGLLPSYYGRWETGC